MYKNIMEKVTLIFNSYYKMTYNVGHFFLPKRLILQTRHFIMN